MNLPPASLQDVLERPQFAHTLPRDKDHPYVIVSTEFLNDKSVSTQARLLMIYLLSLPPEWDGRRIPLIAMKFLGVSLKTAQKYTRELVEAGHLHKIAHQGVGYDDIQYRYKATEMKMKSNEPTKHKWVSSYTRQPHHANRQVRLHKLRRGVIRQAPPSPAEPWKGSPPTRRKTQTRRAQKAPAPPQASAPASPPTTVKACSDAQRARRRASFFGAPPLGKKFLANKVCTGNLHSSDSPFNPLTPFAKGDASQCGFREKSRNKPTRGERPESEGAADSRRAAIAAFDARQLSSPWADKDKLEVLQLASRALDAPLIASWGARKGQQVTVADAEAFLAHPVTGMLQLILDEAAWTFADARRWIRASARTISASEVMTLFRALRDDFEHRCVGSSHGLLASNVRDFFRHGGWKKAKSSPCGITRQHFPHEFVAYAECLHFACEIVADQPFHPADLDIYTENYGLH